MITEKLGEELAALMEKYQDQMDPQEFVKSLIAFSCCVANETAPSSQEAANFCIGTVIDIFTFLNKQE